MNTPKWQAGILSAVAGLAAIFAFWPSFEPALDWFIKNSAIILERPQVQAVIASIAIGVMLAGFLPHVVPGRWPAETTKALTRLVCFLVTGICAYFLANPTNPVESRTALIYALLAALASAQVWTTLSGLLYRVAPKPESLKP
jgi:peptidoglycan/LPS O-acetylase OafA/YrhL